MRKRLFSLVAVLVLLAVIMTVAYLKLPMKEIVVTEEGTTEVVTKYDKESVYLWYSDDALTNYLSSAAVAYNEEHGTRIVPVLQAPVDYLETINSTTMESNVPDMYVISHDALSKAYMAGLAKEIAMDTDTFAVSYIDQARNAVNYKGRLLGYPLNFETSTLIYNETYLKEMAIKALDAEKAALAAEGLIEAIEDASLEDDPNHGYTDEEIGSKISELLPATIEDIKNLANEYDAPENVDGFLSWDVTDIFYNFFFVGDAINLGGPAGWDINDIDIYNTSAVTSLEAYQSLNTFFSIDTDETDYSAVIQDFIDGKLLFTIATTDVVATLENAKADGSFEYEYGATLIPDMSEDLETRSMSVTNCVAVSPYSSHADIAEDFAVFLTREYVDSMYAKSGKVPVASRVNYDYGALSIFALEYDYSYPLPKMLETENFWVDLERTFLKVWNGEDASTELKALSEQLIYQITGEKVELDYISVGEEEEIEYLDEEEYVRQAQSDSEDN